MRFNKVSTKTIFLFIIFLIISPVISYSQNEKLFSEDFNLSMEMTFDFKELYKNTNDSTYIKTKFQIILLHVFIIFGF